MVLADMIDTWLFATLVLAVLALGAILRGFPATSRDDRRVAGTVAVMLVSMAALTLSIAWGMVIIVDIVILLSIASFGVLFWSGQNPGADHP